MGYRWVCREVLPSMMRIFLNLIFGKQFVRTTRKLNSSSLLNHERILSFPPKATMETPGVVSKSSNRENSRHFSKPLFGRLPTRPCQIKSFQMGWRWNCGCYRHAWSTKHHLCLLERKGVGILISQTTQPFAYKIPVISWRNDSMDFPIQREIMVKVWRKPISTSTILLRFVTHPQ